jgi:hypothetical protein
MNSWPTAMPTREDVQVLRPSEAEWAGFVDDQLTGLGIDMVELRRQAHDRDFQSTAARELWVMVGDSEDRSRLPHE